MKPLSEIVATISHGSSCSSHARMTREASKNERHAVSAKRTFLRWSRLSPRGQSFSRLTISSGPIRAMVSVLTQIREKRGEHLDPVPEVLQPDVLVCRMLIIVVIDDRKADHRRAVSLKEIHRNAAAEGREEVGRGAGGVANHGRHLSRNRQIHRGACRAVSRAPDQLDDVRMRQSRRSIRRLMNDEEVLRGNVPLDALADSLRRLG